MSASNCISSAGKRNTEIGDLQKKIFNRFLNKNNYIIVIKLDMVKLKSRSTEYVTKLD